MAGAAGQPNNIESTAFEELTRAPGGFSFSQAVRLCLGRLKRASSDNDGRGKLRFKVNPNLGFPPSDVQDLLFEDDPAAGAEMTLNLMGLHGAGSPIPAYFTEHVAQHQDEPDPLRDFFDLFNHRLIELLYGSWLKYRYHVQFETGAADLLSARFFSFMGLGHQKLRQSGGLDLLRLLPYMGLIAFSGEATGSLASILRHYFRHAALDIMPCVTRRVTIPSDQKSSLGLANSALGEGCLLGEVVRDQTGKFRVAIRNLSWERFNGFLPGGESFSKVKSLVRFVMRSQISFDLELHLRPEDVPPLSIGQDSECRLSWSTWLGEGGDGVALLEPSN